MTLNWFGQPCVQTRRTDQTGLSQFRHLVSFCQWLVYRSAWDLNWSVRWDGKKNARERFSPVRGRKKQLLFAITSPALCFGHCHVMPVTGQWSCYALADKIEKESHVMRLAGGDEKDPGSKMVPSAPTHPKTAYAGLSAKETTNVLKV